MRIYQFLVEGASPGPGVIVVLATSKVQAKAAANEKLNDMSYGSMHRHGHVLRLGEQICPSKPAELTPRAVLYFESGER